MRTLLSAHLIEFDLPTKLVSILSRGGVRTLGDLVRESPQSLRRLPQLGIGSVTKLTSFLHRWDLNFGMKIDMG